MNAQQLTSIINTNYLSPWADDHDQTTYRAAPPKLPSRATHKKPKASFLPHACTLWQADHSLEEDGKRLLLNINIDRKRQQITEIRSYLQRKGKKVQSQVSVRQEHDTKLPALYKAFDSIDYTLLLQDANATTNDIHIFRKYGEHRRNKVHEGGRVERSISYQPLSHNEESSERKRKAETMETVLPMELAPLKLKGKKYSFEEKEGSERRMSTDQCKHTPSQPSITPHYMLFGHNKQDILKKVLQQLNPRNK